MNKESKNFEFKAIDDEKGSVEAVFSVFNKLDTDGDVVLPSAIKSGFKDDQVPMVFAHKWDQPIGKGVITSDDEKATFRGNFFMDTEAGKEAYKLAKAMGDLQEWSFGFKINDYEVKGYISEEMEEEVEARYPKDLTVYEVSQYLLVLIEKLILFLSNLVKKRCTTMITLTKKNSLKMFLKPQKRQKKSRTIRMLWFPYS